MPPTPSTRRAVIDIGTNSVKLLVGDVAGPTVTPVFETSEQTRLGTGFYATQRLQPGPISHTANAALQFANLARQHGAQSVRLIGTSAVRDALNRDDLARALAQATQLPLEILSGQQEADWVCRGVATSPTLAHHPTVIIDAGGGSTEFVAGQPGHIRFRGSFQLGTIRYLEHHPLQDPPTPADWDQCRRDLDAHITTQILPALLPHLTPTRTPWLAVGASGTATILARLHHGLDTYDRSLLEDTVLTAAALAEWRQRLWSIPLAQRRLVPGLPPERADVILPGIAIYDTVLRHLQLPALHITLRGLRFAALLD